MVFNPLFLLSIAWLAVAPQSTTLHNEAEPAYAKMTQVFFAHSKACLCSEIVFSTTLLSQFLTMFYMVIARICSHEEAIMNRVMLDIPDNLY